MCLEYADKIPVNSWVEAVGGNAANSAVGLARLGIETGIVTSVGDDKEGKAVVRTLGREGVRTDWAKIEKGGITDESVILNYKGERTILAYHVPREYHLPQDLPSTNWVYLTSLNEKFEVLHRELLKWLKVHPETKLACNPGTHELKAGLGRNREILQKCEVLILNKEEAEEILQQNHCDRKKIVAHGNDELRGLLETLHRVGPKIVIITDGANGTYCYDGENFLFCDIFPAQRLEMTGAGDAFSAGFLASLTLGENVSEAMRWGNANSASVIQKIGSQEGLLNREQLGKMLKKV